jgi:hypothetical protein
MGKRSLRITKWLASTPTMGLCSRCGKEFKVPITALAKTREAHANLQEQFDRHECKRIK